MKWGEHTNYRWSSVTSEMALQAKGMVYLMSCKLPGFLSKKFHCLLSMGAFANLALGSPSCPCVFTTTCLQCSHPASQQHSSSTSTQSWFNSGEKLISWSEGQPPIHYLMGDRLHTVGPPAEVSDTLQWPGQRRAAQSNTNMLYQRLHCGWYAPQSSLRLTLPLLFKITSLPPLLRHSESSRWDGVSFYWKHVQ